MTAPKTDIEIARSVALKPISEIGAKLGLSGEALIPMGRSKAKIDLRAHTAPPKNGRLVLVTAISPTPAGEGKTTTTIGLGDALNAIGRRAVVVLREPSLGPCFGMKGGATGGGRAQVAPMEDINLHFTGDFHAIGAAHNLAAAMVDNHLHFNKEPELDPANIVWRRVVDMNDRALREVAIGLDDTGGDRNGPARESGFDITVASEVMAAFCLAESLDDLKTRLARMIVGYTEAGDAVTIGDIGAAGAMTALLKDAFLPNLVQTLQGNPAIIHGGPFANIAHGCNSVAATRAGLALADIAVTEAGFGADLGAEKFFNIKCRKSGLAPSAVVVVATVRALKMHGGVAKGDLKKTDADAVTRGGANLARHLQNIAKFGVPAVVAINAFDGDTDEEIAALKAIAAEADVDAFLCRHWAEGADGAIDLAKHVARLTDENAANFQPLYADGASLAKKMETVAREIYRAGSVKFSPEVADKLARFEAMGFGGLPVCMAKTPYSFSDDAKRAGAATDHVLNVRDVRLSAGAGFVVAICGNVMTMPGLPRHPAAEGIDVNDKGEIIGLA